MDYLYIFCFFYDERNILLICKLNQYFTFINAFKINASKLNLNMAEKITWWPSFSGVMVTVFDSRVVDHGIESLFCQTKDY